MMRQSTACRWRLWHMESCYFVSLLGLLNPSDGEEDAMKILCHLSKTKKIDMQAHRDPIIYRLLRYSLGMVTPSMLAKFTADKSYFQECVHYEGNREWYLSWDCRGSYSYNAES
ncbi:unnamed protein product [Prunus armeniaca]|uniref:Uncharacterized protein n=1 Tax=Prunus armeniaca TaxID=36596 RepID=A0A6J5TKX5_PRUAR|nr:unnamed protein product [Prunus armeniaca]